MGVCICESAWACICRNKSAQTCLSVWVWVPAPAWVCKCVRAFVCLDVCVIVCLCKCLHLQVSLGLCECAPVGMAVREQTHSAQERTVQVDKQAGVAPTPHRPRPPPTVCQRLHSWSSLGAAGGSVNGLSSHGPWAAANPGYTPPLPERLGSPTHRCSKGSQAMARRQWRERMGL